MKYKIIADSSCDLDNQYLINLGIDVDFEVIPLTVNVNDVEFIDNERLNVNEMLTAMYDYKGKSASSCPSPNSFLEALNGADKYFIVTISSKLSGSFNSALLAQKSFEKPQDVFVVDSKSASGSLVLVIDKLVSLIKEENPFSDICEKITGYVDNNSRILFTLNNYDNFVKNGRMTIVQAMLTTALHIRIICKGENGEIKIFKKAIGSKIATKFIIDELCAKRKKSDKKCVITHCDNVKLAETLKKELETKNVFSQIRIMPMRGLCSFYALNQGIIISYEV